MSKPKVLICPYCGETQSAGERCRACGGLFEPLSRQATHNAMGPWFVRDEGKPFQPGCSYETIIKLVERGTLNKYSIVRSPTTKQFWTIAKHVPGIAHLLGYCHNCDASVDPGDHGCHACGVPFGAYLDRNFLGLPDVRPMPWEAPLPEGRDEAPTSRQTFDFRRAAEPMGISSFASDEELRAGGLEPLPHRSQAFGGGGGPATPSAGRPYAGSTASAGVATLEALGTETDLARRLAGESTTPVEAVPPIPQPAAASLTSALLDPSPAGVAARAMQRRLDRQRQTIHKLTIAVFVVSAAAVIAVAAFLARSGTPAATTPESASTPATQQPSAAKPADVSHASGSDHQEVAPNPAAAATQPAAPPSAPDPSARLKHAQELLDAARQADRAIGDRISDYEAALAALKAIAQDTPAAQRPAELDAMLRQAQQELERLKLQEFFP